MKRNCETCHYADKKRSDMVRFGCKYRPELKEILSLYPKELVRKTYGFNTDFVSIPIYFMDVSKAELFECERWKQKEIKISK